MYHSAYQRGSGQSWILRTWSASAKPLPFADRVDFPFFLFVIAGEGDSGMRAGSPYFALEFAGLSGEASVGDVPKLVRMWKGLQTS